MLGLGRYTTQPDGEASLSVGVSKVVSRIQLVPIDVNLELLSNRFSAFTTARQTKLKSDRLISRTNAYERFVQLCFAACKETTQFLC